MVGSKTNRKRKMFFANLRINPSSEKLINFKPYALKREQIQQESKVIRELLIKFMEKTEYLHNFKRKNSLTLDSVREALDNMLDFVHLEIFHISLFDHIRKSNTTLHEFHITTDLKCSRPEIAVLLYDYMISGIFTEVYQLQSAKDEIDLRNSYYFKRASQNAGLGIVNWARGNAGIVYAKGYNQLANKIRRVGNKNGLSVAEMEHLREMIKKNIENFDGKIRVETQMKTPTAIQDMFNYKRHNVMVEIMTAIINFVELNIKDEDKEQETKNVVKVLSCPQKYLWEIIASLRSIIREEIKLLRFYKTLPDDPPRQPPNELTLLII